MEYPKEWDYNWVSNEEYLSLTGTILLGAYVATNSKGQVGMRLSMHIPEWIENARKL